MDCTTTSPSQGGFMDSKMPRCEAWGFDLVGQGLRLGAFSQLVPTLSRVLEGEQWIQVRSLSSAPTIGAGCEERLSTCNNPLAALMPMSSPCFVAPTIGFNGKMIKKFERRYKHGNMKRSNRTRNMANPSEQSRKSRRKP